MGTEPATLYAWANLELPQWGTMLGIDPVTGDEVWERITGDDGKQLEVSYRRGQVVDPSHLRQSDIDELTRWGSLGPTPPAPDAPPGTPVPEGVVHVTSGDGAAVASESQAGPA